MSCSSRKAGHGDCGSHGHTGVHTYALKFTVKPALWARGVRTVSCMGASCLLVKTDGQVWAHGVQMGGQFGGDLPYEVTPAAKVNVSGVVDVAVSIQHALFLTEDGRALSAGQNSQGSIGTGSAAATAAYPMEIMRDVAAVSVGMAHSLLLKKDGTLFATGSNFAGQLGTGDGLIRYAPVEILKGVKAISAGLASSAAIMKDGRLMVTGDVGSGGYTLGVGDTLGRKSFTEVPEMSDVKAFSFGVTHALVLKADGTLLGTGLNNFGQLGGDASAEPVTTFTKVAEGVKAASAGVANSLIAQDGRFFALGIGLIDTELPSNLLQVQSELVQVELPVVSSPASQATRLWSGVPAVPHGSAQRWTVPALAGLVVMGFVAIVAGKRRAAVFGDAGDPQADPMSSSLE